MASGNQHHCRKKEERPMKDSLYLHGRLPFRYSKTKRMSKKNKRKPLGDCKTMQDIRAGDAAIMQEPPVGVLSSY
jgi:hypothetical protein